MWSTPQDFFMELDEEFDFTLDPCCTKDNQKCEKYYTKEDDGLSKSWDNEYVFMNPPYGREIGKWVKKASESRGGWLYVYYQLAQIQGGFMITSTTKQR